jgi:hypothetical protein
MAAETAAELAAFLRASEFCSLRWEQVGPVHGRLQINRLKNGIVSVHPLTAIPPPLEAVPR